MVGPVEQRLDKHVYLKEIDIFHDLTTEEIVALGKRAPMREVAAGSLFYSPLEPTEVLFILKAGRVRRAAAGQYPRP